MVQKPKKVKKLTEAELKEQEVEEQEFEFRRLQMQADSLTWKSLDNEDELIQREQREQEKQDDEKLYMETEYLEDQKKTVNLKEKYKEINKTLKDQGLKQYKKKEIKELIKQKSVSELNEILKKNNIKGYSKLKKNEKIKIVDDIAYKESNARVRKIRNNRKTDFIKKVKREKKALENIRTELRERAFQLGKETEYLENLKNKFGDNEYEKEKQLLKNMYRETKQAKKNQIEKLKNEGSTIGNIVADLEEKEMKVLKEKRKKTKTEIKKVEKQKKEKEMKVEKPKKEKKEEIKKVEKPKKEKPKKEKKEKEIKIQEPIQQLTIDDIKGEDITNVQTIQDYKHVPVSELTKLLKLNNLKGISKLKKAEKIKVLLENNITIPIFEKKIRQPKQYGIVGGKVKPYSEIEQIENINPEVSVDPLKQKKLDPIKNKKAYEMKIEYILNPHQKEFILHFITNYVKGGLMFHSVGSGKTLTAVAFAHYYLAVHPTNNVVIISPPALLFNFVDTAAMFGLDVRDNRFKYTTYNVYSKDHATISNNKSLIILDETHLMRTSIIKSGGEDDKDGEVDILKGAIPYGVLQGVLKAHKILCMTGTPFINQLYDIENIMAFINQRNPYEMQTFKTIIEDPMNKIDYFNYKISYFNIMDTPSKIYFPKVNDIYVPIVLQGFEKNLYNSVANGSEIFNFVQSRTQPIKFKNKYEQLAFDSQNPFKLSVKLKKIPDEHVAEIKKALKDDKKAEAFEKKVLKVLQYNQERKAEISENRLSAYYNGPRLYGNIIGGYKIEYILNKIKENPTYKTIVYSTFLIILNFIANELKINNIGVRMITGDETTTSKNKSKNDFNNSDNVQVLLISKAGTEGVDCKNVRQFFLMESQWNSAIEEQAIARAIRFRSHMSLPEDQRFVNVYRLMICTTLEEEEYVKQFQNNINRINDAAVATSNVNKIYAKLDKLFSKAIHLSHHFNKLKTSYNLFKVQKKEEMFAAWKRNRPGFGQTKDPFEEPKRKDYFLSFLTTKSDIMFQYFNNLTDPEKFKLDMSTTNTPESIQQAQNIVEDMIKLVPEYYKELTAKLETGTSAEKGYTSADIELKLMSVRKSADIEPFIDDLKSHLILAIEDIQTTTYGDFYKEYQNIELNSENINNLIKNQQKIINESTETIALSSDLLNVIIDAGYDEMKRNIQSNEVLTHRLGSKEASQEFFTPPEIAEEMIKYFFEKSDIANNRMDIIDILEPTAGAGMLCREIIKQFSEQKIINYKLYMCEFQERNRQILQTIRDITPMTTELVTSTNFLKYIPDERFDLIFMNPPFNLKKQLTGEKRSVYAIDFLLKAYQLLKVGGEIYIIGPNNLFMKRTPATKIFNAIDKEHKSVELLAKYESYRWKLQDNTSISLSFGIWRIVKIKESKATAGLLELLSVYAQDDTILEKVYEEMGKSEQVLYKEGKKRETQKINNYITELIKENSDTNEYKITPLADDEKYIIKTVEKNSTEDLKLKEDILNNPLTDILTQQNDNRSESLKKLQAEVYTERDKRRAKGPKRIRRDIYENILEKQLLGTETFKKKLSIFLSNEYTNDKQITSLFNLIDSLTALEEDFDKHPEISGKIKTLKKLIKYFNLIFNTMGIDEKGYPWTNDIFVSNINKVLDKIPSFEKINDKVYKINKNQINSDDEDVKIVHAPEEKLNDQQNFNNSLIIGAISQTANNLITVNIDTTGIKTANELKKQMNKESTFTTTDLARLKKLNKEYINIQGKYTYTQLQKMKNEIEILQKKMDS